MSQIISTTTQLSGMQSTTELIARCASLPLEAANIIIYLYKRQLLRVVEVNIVMG